jgi:transcriptional regulator with XRE-family HTH domain
MVRHRMTHGLTQKESARRIGVDPSTLARWERGELEPMTDMALKLNVSSATLEVLRPRLI